MNQAADGSSWARHHPQATGTILASLASVGAATFLILWKLVADGGSRGALVFVLLLTAAVICSVITVITTRSLRWPIDRIGLQTAAILGVCTIVGNLASLIGLSTCNPTVASVVFQLQIFIIAALEWILLKHRITPMMLLGAVIAVGGVIVMQVGNRSPSDLTAGNDLVGMAWIMVAAAMFAVMLVVTRRVADRINMLTVNSIRLWLAAFVLACWPGVIPDVMNLTPQSWLYAGAAGCCGLVLSRTLLMITVRYIPATTTKLITLTTPIFTLILSWLFLAEVPDRRALAGGAVILIGVALPLTWAWLRDRRMMGQPDSPNRRGAETQRDE